MKTSRKNAATPNVAYLARWIDLQLSTITDGVSAGSREHWLDVQARALYQAANRVAEIANKFFNA